METKYVFVTGGVISGLGKGITAASLGRLLKNRGYKVAAQKLDPYLNIDPGTMSPYQHGEVFVTEDGAEADLDLGHYERFIDENLNRFSNLTTGKVYWTLLNKERRGDYLGSTVQVIPHVTDEIKTFLYAVGRAAGADVVITEVGGTVGDIESQPFLEAIRQVAAEVGPRNRVFLHVTPLFYVPRSGEIKTKPTQHSVKELQSAGIAPDLIILRSDGPVEEAVLEKIALFCNVKKDCVIPNRSVEELYEAPVMLEEAHLSQIVCRELDLDPRILDMGEWEAMLARIRARRGTVTVALVGKYVRLHDAYLSVAEALAHGGYHNGVAVKIRWLESEDLADEAAAEQALAGADGILVPGGFGSRGVEGKILAARYARTHKVPYLGICLGMQTAVISFARDVLGLADANSGEFALESPHKVIDLLPDQREDLPKGGTMRLGAYPCRLAPGTKLSQVYDGAAQVAERHRHRYEFVNTYRAPMEAAGLRVAGTSPDGSLVEAVELTGHPFYLGVQYHPEFKSRPGKAHPLFAAFVRACLEVNHP